MSQRDDNLRNSQPEGMGLERRKSQKVKRSVPSSNNKTAQGARDVAEGSQQAAAGAARASQGAGRVMAGDLSGGVDVAKGAKDTVQGGSKAIQGAKDVKEGVDDATNKDVGGDSSTGDQDGSNEFDTNDRNNSQLSNPYDPDSYKSLFDEDDGEDPDSEFNQNLKDGNQNTDASTSKSMKDMMSEDDDDKNKEDDDKDKDDDDEDDEDDEDGDEDEDEEIDLKDVAAKAQAAQTAASAYSSLMAFRAFMAMMQWMKNMAMAVATAVQSLWASAMAVFQTVVSTVASVTGLSAAWAAGVAVTSAVVTVGAAIAGVIAVSEPEIEKYDDLFCYPDQTEVGANVREWEESGDRSAQYEENIRKAWSFMSEMGVNPVAFAGIIGNFTHESSMDPTGIETIRGEPFQIGPKKTQAIGYDYEMSKINPAYQRKYPGVKKAGIGIAQWSNGRNTQLRDYADEIGGDWYDIGVQFAFMFDGDNPSDRKIMLEIANDTSSTIEEVTKRFMLEWERPSKKAYHLDKRYQAASEIYFKVQTMEVDVDYAQSIISGMNSKVAVGNSNRSSYYQDDGCGKEIQDHYKTIPDGTGVFPEGLGSTMWSPDTLPASVKKFTHDPKDVGMSYGSPMGWQPTSYPGQCVALSHSYMVAIYGLSTVNGVNGADVARGWYEAHHETSGGQLLDAPQAGAVFGYKNTGVYGHTGVVQHVFANGDLLVLEQNVNGISGDNNGMPNTWGWRYFPAARYKEHSHLSYDWEFYKPDLEPNWSN